MALVTIGGAWAAHAEDCQTAPIGTPCDDGNFCNGADQCGEKVLDERTVRGCFFHIGNPCVGGGECADRCNEAADNCFEPAETPCAIDGNVCTDDVCDGAGICAHLPKDGAVPCDDGVFCNGADTCVAGRCDDHGGDPCTGGPECANVCNEDGDTCFTPVNTPCADDDNACTDDVCDGLGVCAKLPNEEPCDDGLFCNGEDACGDGSCSFHVGDPCAGNCVESCDESADTCVEPAGTRCDDDGNPCTADLCMSGGCTHALIPGCRVCRTDADCDDTSPCTEDGCGTEGCENTPIAGCVACAADDDCDDGDACTEDRCSIAGNCQHADAECFAAVSCPFVERLGMDACAGERIPGSISRLVDRAGCKLERAELRARDGRNRISRSLKGAMEILARANEKTGRANGRKISGPCAAAVAAELADRSALIDALVDDDNGGAVLAECTSALVAPGTAPGSSGPSLCRSR